MTGSFLPFRHGMRVHVDAYRTVSVPCARMHCFEHLLIRVLVGRHLVFLAHARTTDDGVGDCSPFVFRPGLVSGASRAQATNSKARRVSGTSTCAGTVKLSIT
jgi:hypothetical protein